MLPNEQPETVLVGWPDVPTTGEGVWITERLKADAFPGVRLVPVPVSPAGWREKRALIVSRVQDSIPDAKLTRYRGGVARFEGELSTVEAYIFGYDASHRLTDDDACDKCGASTADGEGYDGLCGNCADVAEAAGRWL